MRDIVIAALDKATGILNNADLARPLLGGHDVAFDQFEMDSLSLFEVIMELEERLGLELDADAVVASVSVAGLVSYLEARIDAKVLPGA